MNIEDLTLEEAWNTLYKLENKAMRRIFSSNSAINWTILRNY